MGLQQTRILIDEARNWFFYSDRKAPLRHGVTMYYAAAHRLKGSKTLEDIKRVHMIDTVLDTLPNNETAEQHHNNLAKYF